MISTHLPEKARSRKSLAHTFFDCIQDGRVIWQDEVRLIRQAEENAKWEKLRKEREEAQKAEL
jgi:hypothetical protein